MNSFRTHVLRILWLKTKLNPVGEVGFILVLLWIKGIFFFSFIVFCLGLLGMLSARNDIIIILISLEVASVLWGLVLGLFLYT